MDQAKIGGFIAARRKELGLTQAQLAEKLSVTDKAVSKWETGRGLPDASLFEPLCSELGVSLGELFAGERVEPADLTWRTEAAAIGLLGLLDEWTRQRKVVGALFLTALALDLALLLLWRPYARLNKDCRGVQWAMLAAGAVLFLSAAVALGLCIASGGDVYRMQPLYRMGLRVGLPCIFLFSGLFPKTLPEPEIFFVFMAGLGLFRLIDAARNLRALRKN